MSDRNTGLFLAGHVPADAVAAAFSAISNLDPGELTGDEAPRVGHGQWKGRPYTHVGLRLFEVGGLLLIDSVGAPSDDELEMQLGAALSRRSGEAVFLLYDDEAGVGGHARFSSGRLASRRVVDGRGNRPVVRDLAGERPLEGLDASDWVWTPIAEAVESGASPLFGPGVRTDDEIATLIQNANAQPIKLGAARAPSASRPEAAARPEPAARPAGPRADEGGSARGGLLGRLARKVAGKVRGS